MMYSTSTTRARSGTSTCTASRVDAVLDVFLGDVTGLIAHGLVTRERAIDWVRDLTDVLVLEAVVRFQVKIMPPTGKVVALDYEVSDDGSIIGADGCGGLSSHWIPANSTVSLVIRWRTEAPKYAAARALLQGRGWGAGTMVDAEGAADRTYSKNGYGLYRRTVGWQA